jgi:hypothetical protein
MNSQNGNRSVCCPEFDPKLWDDKVFEWDKKLFIRDKVCTFFYMPMNFGQVMTRLDKKVRNATANIPDGLCLSYHTSKWKMDVLLAVDKEIPGMENTTISGKFYSKAYEGPFRDTGKWCKDYENIAKSKGFVIKKMFMWYTTCPRCAKKYGKNYVAIISEIE